MSARVELDIAGMTCASCAHRIERRLNKIDGVAATVNYATEKASVEYDAGLTPADLIATVEAAGYRAALPAADAPDVDHAAQLRPRLLLAAILSVPVVAVSMTPALQWPGWGWWMLALTTPVVLGAGWPFHRAALVNLRHGATTMDTLVSVGTLAAYVWSLWALVAGGHLYLEAAAAVTTFLLAGRFAEARSKRHAGAALRALLSLGAKDVAVLRDGAEHRVPIGSLRVGEEFVVRPGEKVATDGVVVDGASAIDASLVTGESLPVDVLPGDAVTGATVNTLGRLVVRATRVGADTQLARMAALVEQAQSGKAAVQRLADRVSAVFVPVVIGLALLTLVGWLALGGSATEAFTASVAVLIIACPCALGLATPTALLVGTGRGAQLGVVIRGPEVLESTRAVDVVVLDKTGTVTTGHLSVVATDLSADSLRLAAAVEAAPEHPVARAVLAAYDGVPPAVTGFASTPGVGVSGLVEGHRVCVGRGRRGVEVSVDGVVRGELEVADVVKESSAQAIRSLRELGLRPVLLTGDARPVAEKVATEVGIEDVYAGVLPSEKVDVIKRLQDEGHVVAMVGDGVNDAAALAQADLGLAMGTGTDAAIEASDLTLVSGDLRRAADAIRLSRATLRVIEQNLFWAFAYNVAAIPLAAAGLLDPMIAGAAMACSSVFVVGNSLRLRRFR